MIFAGLGCPHGCDFCCTSHFFKRHHVRLLPTGDDIYRVIDRYLEIDPGMNLAIIDEDFLVARDRATRLRELVLERGRPLSIFAFATVRSLSRLTPRELLETGIDGVWVGYEGKRSGYAKQQGRPVEELIPELRSHGITVLSSMILGFDYQTADVIREELSEFLALKPTFAQFLIYGPTPGTPFFERVVREGRLHRELAENPERYYRMKSRLCNANVLRRTSGFWVRPFCDRSRLRSPAGSDTTIRTPPISAPRRRGGLKRFGRRTRFSA
jgi:radical SAM superfamily enzyme YgiQ (UPF0313 family)